MSTEIDSRRYPTMAKYLASLPNGLTSYPEAQTNAGFFEYMRQTHPDLKKLDGLPAELRSLLENDRTPDWIPEVLGNMFYLLLRDAALPDDAAFMKWAFDANAYAFNKPWARVLMYVLSPTLIVMGAGKRWSAFHKGSALQNAPAERDGSRVVVRGTLTFPAGLFPDLALAVFAKAFEAAVIGAKAKNAICAIENRASDRAGFRLSWDA